MDAGPYLHALLLARAVHKKNYQTWSIEIILSYKCIRQLANTPPLESAQPQKLCTTNFSSGTLKTLINRPHARNTKYFDNILLKFQGIFGLFFLLRGHFCTNLHEICPQLCHILTFPGPSCRPGRILKAQNGWYRCPAYSTTCFRFNPHLWVVFQAQKVSFVKNSHFWLFLG